VYNTEILGNISILQDFFMSFSGHDGYADCDVATYVLTLTNSHDNKPKSYITNNPYPVYVMRQLASCN